MSYDTRLEKLEAVLREGRPLTALQIARRLRCSKPTVYARLAALQERGSKLKLSETRAGKRGPKATAFSLIPE